MPDQSAAPTTAQSRFSRKSPQPGNSRPVTQFSENTSPQNQATQPSSDPHQIPVNQPGENGINQQPIPEQQPPVQPTPEQESQQAAPNADQLPTNLKPQPEEVIAQWEAPNRPFKKRGKQYYASATVITALIAIILLAFGQFFFMAVVIAAGFLAYVIATVPPNEVTYSLTTYGIRIEDQLFYWEELGRFWVEQKAGQDVIYIETFRLPGRITLLGGKNVVIANLAEVLAEVLLYEKPAPTLYDRVGEFFEKMFPLEEDDTPPSHNS